MMVKQDAVRIIKNFTQTRQKEDPRKKRTTDETDRHFLHSSMPEQKPKPYHPQKCNLEIASRVDVGERQIFTFPNKY